MSNDIILVENIIKKYDNTIILNNVSASFEKGKIHGIIGRNGSGKTVLLKCICGFTRLTSGNIRVRGKLVCKEIDVPENLGIIIETPGYLPNYSGFRNLKFLSSLLNKIGDAQIRSSMEKVGLDPSSKKHVGKYSMGMRQRLGIAQAIMENPDILILDEPMNGLDNSGVAEMRELLLKLKDDGKTILMASHNSEDIGLLCDTVCEMDCGSLLKR